MIPSLILAFLIELILCLLFGLPCSFSYDTDEFGPFSGLVMFFCWFILRFRVAIETFLMDLSLR